MRPPTRCRVTAAIGSLLLGISACDRRELAGPPELRLGRDECVECGMIIDDERFACATLVIDRGRREHRRFDDIACLLDFDRSGVSDASVIARYFRDHGTRGWINADAAQFLLADRAKLLTPMGSGIAAFHGRAEAERAQRDLGGEILDYAGLADARKAWMESRFGPPGR
jgi:nitrous oxide reductase accessory protein NosL